MPFELFVWISIMVLAVILAWPRKGDIESEWHERQGIEPMSKEDIKINAELAARRRGK